MRITLLRAIRMMQIITREKLIQYKILVYYTTLYCKCRKEHFTLLEGGTINRPLVHKNGPWRYCRRCSSQEVKDATHTHASVAQRKTAYRMVKKKERLRWKSATKRKSIAFRRTRPARRTLSGSKFDAR